MHCVLIGNYGVANLGDEALKDYFLASFPDAHWTVLSAHPTQSNEAYRLPGGVRSLFLTPWWRTMYIIKQADAVVFGGGSLFTDVESVYACLLWFIHAAWARFCGTPVHLAFQGIGPFQTKLGEACARWTVLHAASVSVRDAASLARIQKWGKGIKVVQSFDPVFSFMEKQKHNKDAKNVFSIIPRHNSGASLRSAIESVMKKEGKPDVFRVILMQPDDPSEQEWVRQFKEWAEVPVEILPARTLDQLMHGIVDARMVITERFHGALAALASRLPMEIVSQGKGDKLDELRSAVVQGFDVQAAHRLIADGERALRSGLGD